VLTETGRVVAVEPGKLWVETIRQSVCGSCAAQKGCGHGLLNQIGDGHRNYLQLSSRSFSRNQFQIDDRVTIGVPERLMLRGSAVLYLLPLACMLLASLAMPTLLPAISELASIGGAVGGFAVGLLLVRWHARYHQDNPDFQPRLLGLAR
jgi:sigma-E factor negative regulatory protein RseC